MAVWLGVGVAVSRLAVECCSLYAALQAQGGAIGGRQSPRHHSPVANNRHLTGSQSAIIRILSNIKPLELRLMDFRAVFEKLLVFLMGTLLWRGSMGNGDWSQTSGQAHRQPCGDG